MESIEFIKKLSSSEYSEALQWFNNFWETAASNRAKFVEEILKITSDCLPIFSLLKKKTLGTALCQAVFDAIGNILFSILTECQANVANVEHITRLLFTKFSQFLTTAFELKCSGSVLRCLTASVMACEESANIVIESLDWSLMQVAIQQRNPDVPIDSRSWSIYFYTAILNLKNCQLTEHFFKSGALPLIFRGLNTDPCDRVVAVITALHEKILLNPDVKQKGLKVHIFNSLTLEPILKISKWTGPKTNKISSITIEEEEEDINVENLEEIRAGREKIIDAQCAFLTTLCTSYTFGIAARAYADHKPSNGHVLDLIKLLPTTSFVDKRYRKLIVESLVACPDIRMQYAVAMSSRLIIGPDKYFMGFVKMYEELIYRTHAEALARRGFDAVKKFLMPVPVSSYFISLLLRHKSQDLKLKSCALSLMLSVLIMGNRIVKAMHRESWFIVAGQVENLIIAFVEECIPDIKLVLDVWNEIFKKNEVESMVDSLLVIVKLLALHSRLQLAPELHKVVKPDQILEQVSQLSVLNEEQRLPLLITCMQLATSCQSKFDAFSLAQNTETQSELFQSFKMLFTIYLDSKNMMDDEENRREKILTPLLEHIETSLVNYGFFDQGESNIELWLEELVGRGPECINFLCDSIVTTIASMEHFSDKVVVITSNSKTDEPFDFNRMLDEYPVELLIKDNTDISVSNIDLSFSRLILGNLAVLSKAPTAEVTEYFSVVIQRYIRLLPDPQVLVRYLMTDCDIEMPDPLMQCCRCWLGKKPKRPIPESDGDTFSTKLSNIFFAKNFSAVDALISETALPETLKERKELLRSLLTYIHADTSENSSVAKNASPAYAKLLEHVMRSTVEDFKEEASKLSIFSVALDHPALISRYSIFSSDPLQSMATHLLTELFQEKTSNLKIMTPYFKKACDQLQSRITLENSPGEIDFMFPFTPFFLDGLFTCASLSSLLDIISSASEEYYSNDSFVELASKTVTELKQKSSSLNLQDQRCLNQLAKRHLMSLCHVITDSDGPSYAFVAFLKNLQSLLAVTLVPADAETIERGALKWMFSLSKHLGSDLLLQTMKLHPPHASFVVKRLKKTLWFPSHATLLLELFNACEDETSPFHTLVDHELVTANLAAAKPFVVEWLKDYDAEQEMGYTGLTTKLIDAGLIDPSEAVSVVKVIYPRIMEGENPPLHLASVCAVCLTLKGHKKESRLPNPDALLTTVHMILCCLERCCHRALRDKLKPEQRQILTEMMLLLNDLLPRLSRRSREAKADTALWTKFSKKVARSCLRDNNNHVEESAALLGCLPDLCTWQFSNAEDSQPPADLVKLFVNNPRFQKIMGEAEIEDQLVLKERILNLLCVLQKLCPAVALQYPASSLLTAYHATTGLADQAALQLLKQYEDSGYMEDLLPVVWGAFASRYFSSAGDVPVFREPKPERIIENLDLKVLVNTCLNFDVFMSARFDVRCREPEKNRGTLYDLRFLIPLLIFVTRSFIDAQTQPTHQVLPLLVAVGIATMSAQERSIRGLGATLLRALQKLVPGLTPESVRLYWTWLIDIARHTVAASAVATKSSYEKMSARRPRSCAKLPLAHQQEEIDDSARPSQRMVAVDVTSFPLPGPMCRFLVEATLCSDHADHPVFPALMNYLFLFPHLRPQTFPEMLRLYNSNSISEAASERLLFLRLISEGIKTEDDYYFVEASKAPMHVMALLHSVTVPPVLMLDVLAAVGGMCSTPYGANRLLRHYELLHLLPNMLSKCSATSNVKRSLVSATVDVLSTAWYCLTHAQEFRRRRRGLLHLEAIGDAVEEQEDAEYLEDDFYDDNLQEEDSDEEEKSKLKKKRKLEAKKYASKKMKQNDGNAVVVGQEITYKRNNYIDVYFLADFAQCLDTIADDVYNSKSSALALTKFEELKEKFISFAKSWQSSVSGAALQISIESLLKRKLRSPESDDEM
ncbi:uncharacterized protein LOC108669517 isoform X2 [Hyalella azteca]|uniref:Uncharacterized protein LOC108669517 isoform X2 n=1 Tax=Hyalella azteca TaxID=294128 RepID=A0A8B7NG04_HYAAZ|nr:uncharacterized protein LOC108669517 isoform X2 [Hyalella azteca]